MKTPASLAFFMVILILHVHANKPLFHEGDTVQLREVEIISSRIIYSLNDQQLSQPDTTFLKRASYTSLQDLMTNQTAMHVRASGSGLLSTSSIRGGAAVHTEVLWNGFALNSPMNGLTDLSLLPALFFDHVEVIQGSNHAVAGLGGIGGSLFVQNSPDREKGIRLMAGMHAGSFGKWMPFGDFAYTHNHGNLRVRSFFLQAENNFPFPDPNSPEEKTKRLSNASQQQGGALAEKYLHFNRHQLAFRFWYQKATREIPPTAFQQNSNAIQYDEVFRPQFEWQWLLSDRLNLKFRSSASKELNEYFDPQPGIEGVNDSRIFSQQVIADWRFRERQRIFISANYQYQEATTNNYNGTAVRNLVSAQAMYQAAFFNRLLTTSLSGRLTHATLHELLPAAALGLQYKLTDAIRVNYHANYHHRLPSFNDVFWEPGGNRELLPEVAFSNEIGFLIELLQNQDRNHLTIHPAVYYRNMANYIQWRPGSRGFWEGFNIGDVISKGFEFSLNYRFELNTDIQFLFNGQFNRSHSYRKEVAEQHQLLHIPLHAGTASFAVQHQRFFAGIEWIYSGKRYTTTDNSLYVEPHQIFNLIVQYSPLQDKHGLNLKGRLNNVLNTSYENISSRPMPGINFEVGIFYLFNSNP